MPLPQKTMASMGAADFLGLGDSSGLGDMLTKQTAAETEELRRRRMQQMKLSQLGAAGGSLASLALFGGMGERSFGG